ncbi:hypothetical protein QZK40_12645, partial [Acinetobacter baumannii]|nr:hypothetical protein [Acinetobacter baumannii]
GLTLDIYVVLLVVILHQLFIETLKGAWITSNLFTQFNNMSLKDIAIPRLEAYLLTLVLQEAIVKRPIVLVIVHLEHIVLGRGGDITALIAQVQKDIFHDKLYKLQEAPLNIDYWRGICFIIIFKIISCLFEVL